MINAFNSGVDIHTATAAQVFDVPEILVTPSMRSSAKAVNFGIVYGIGAFSLSNDIGVSVKEADRYIKNYLTVYSGVDKFMKNVVKDGEENGFVTTLFNRRRYMPELKASNRMVKAAGERIARNAPIQGTAADIIKIAMVKVYNRLKNEGLKSRLILQVHDELIAECPREEADIVAKIIAEEMQNSAELKVQLVADVNVGENWLLAKG
jgi:DNA polymerase-1